MNEVDEPPTARNKGLAARVCPSLADGTEERSRRGQGMQGKTPRSDFKDKSIMRIG